VAGVLPLPQPVEHDRKAEVDVRRGRVDAELHAQRPALLELALEPSLREDVHRMACGDERFHGRESSETVAEQGRATTPAPVQSRALRAAA